MCRSALGESRPTNVFGKRVSITRVGRVGASKISPLDPVAACVSHVVMTASQREIHMKVKTNKFSHSRKIKMCTKKGSSSLFFYASADAHQVCKAMGFEEHTH